MTNPNQLDLFIKKSEFQQGFACAVSCIVSGYGSSAETKEALRCAGLTSEQKMIEAGVDEYDIEILRPLLNEMKD